jgi:hypothetical protein
MLYTNLKYIVSKENDTEQLQDILTELKLTEKGKFAFQMEPFPAVILPKGLTFKDVQDMLPDHEIKFKAIGDNEIELPYSMNKAYKHYFTPDEKTAIADEFCKKQADKEKFETEKADLTRKYKVKIDSCEDEIRTLAQKHREGWEEKAAECIVRIDFKGKAKYFIHKETKEVLATDDLTTDDYQLRIDSIPVKGEK